MKWTRAELERSSGTVFFDEEVVIDASVFANSTLINGVKDVHADGNGYLNDEDDFFEVDIHITGVMICPDAITGEDIDVPFDTDSHEVYSFEEADEDGVRVVTDEVVDLTDAVIDAILLEVPLAATNTSEDDLPSGDGWRVMTEEEYQNSRKERIDPRLAKLKEFKNE